ncbi:MAG TPA: hypothetical protein PKL62_14475 [Accumulibacter sp.]|uniref:hypothetical protein n=1 Tax=Accumulibacter sp. TaxID=2053492 RepID=UPI002BEEBFC0|nr:hypothetical protein [Accumulibacter sp.]HNN85347.1 hypothetical protein [Accumulibacter sp.]
MRLRLYNRRQRRCREKLDVVMGRTAEMQPLVARFGWLVQERNERLRRRGESA